jgi:hypothetical protein
MIPTLLVLSVIAGGYWIWLWRRPARRDHVSEDWVKQQIRERRDG